MNISKYVVTQKISGNPILYNTLSIIRNRIIINGTYCCIIVFCPVIISETLFPLSTAASMLYKFAYV